MAKKLDKNEEKKPDSKVQDTTKNDLYFNLGRLQAILSQKTAEYNEIKRQYDAIQSSINELDK